MGPIDLNSLGTLVTYVVYFSIGMGFGAVLESSGFGDSRRLAAQFYLRDMTVLKVMFTAIITAMTLIFFSSALGLLDFSKIWVNHTYLLPGIVGGLIMGVGFIIGGFCPGTSVVAASTLKLDGWIFLGGVAFGVFLFGETVPLYQDFWHSSHYGRFTIPDWLGISYGAAVLGVIVMALLMFYGGELAERIFGQGQKPSELTFVPRNRRKLAAAGTLLLVALVTLIIGQPDTQRRWRWVEPLAQGQLADRSVYVHPGEVVELKQNAALNVRILDIRPEQDTNLFRVMDSRRVALEDVDSPLLLQSLGSAPANTIVFLISNGERMATEAWKRLRAHAIPNIYIVEGGYNHWLSVYVPDPCIAEPLGEGAHRGDDEALHYRFFQAVGERTYAAHPDCACKRPPTDCFLASNPGLHNRPTVTHDPKAPKVSYTRKVTLTTASKPKGGCG